MRRLPVLLALSLVACADQGLDPDGYHWEVVITGTEDLCSDEPPGYQETFTYSLFFDGSRTDLKIGDETFAQGTLSGCLLSYESFQVGERRGPNDEYWIKWTLTGETTLRQGGSSCDLDPDVDWLGIEVFTLDEASEELGYPKDCTYTTSVEGTYLGHGADV